MTYEQSMIQILNSFTDDYKLQMLRLEKLIGYVRNPQTTDELKEELTLRYERLASRPDLGKAKDYNEEQALLMDHFKEKCRNCGKLGYNASQCKLKQVEEKKMDVICNYCKKS
jgi:hypothetical protein